MNVDHLIMYCHLSDSRKKLIGALRESNKFFRDGSEESEIIINMIDRIDNLIKSIDGK